MGNVIQIDAELKNVIVRNLINNSPFQVGDIITKLNNQEIKSYNDLSAFINNLDDNEIVNLVVIRNKQELSINTSRKILTQINFHNLLSGFATLTYINPETGEFGAVGHPINVGPTRQVSIKYGAISSTNSLHVKKSKKGYVGCLSAKKEEAIGEFVTNAQFGIKGKVLTSDFSHLKAYKVANLNEVDVGKAYAILQNDDGKCKQYEIEITNVDYQPSPEAKTFKIKIVDQNLLDRTGGIVQGMSGTPIIQNDKIIGAISHAIENNPAVGYGIYIKWMYQVE
jgi:stage IV sporulation protein B